MENKKFDEYTKEEQKNLLFHWWKYYSRDIYTLEELEIFEGMLDDDCKNTYQLAVLSYINGYGNKLLLGAMRNDALEELKGKVPDFGKSGLEFKKYFEEEEEAFISEIVNSYNNPEPSIPLDSETIREQLEALIARNEKRESKTLTSMMVDEIFRDSLFREEEIIDGKPVEAFTIGEGITGNALFHTGRLNEHKNEINQMLEMILDAGDIVPFVNLCVLKDGRLWSGEHYIMEELVVLGIASEILKYPFERELWDNCPGGLPFVIKNEEKLATEVIGHDPSEYEQCIEQIKIKQKGKRN